MSGRIKLVNSPVLKSGCRLRTLEDDCLLIENGWRGLQIDCGNLGSEGMIRILNSAAGELPEDALDLLVSRGVIVEQNLSDGDSVSARYVAYRLLDRYKDSAGPLWNASPLFDALSKSGNRLLAIGMLLESYFHIRAANWTAAPALLHSMSGKQRELLEAFFVDEKGHGEYIYHCFGLVDLNPVEVKDALPSVETELFERLMYSCAARSPIEFATALIVPEIPEITDETEEAADREDLVSLIENVQKIPTEICRRFRAHDGDNTTLGHETLPIELIAERGTMSVPEMRSLFVTLHTVIDAYRSLLDGVHRRYSTLVNINEMLVLPRNIKL